MTVMSTPFLETKVDMQNPSLFQHDIVIEFHTKFNTKVELQCQHRLLNRILHRLRYKVLPK